MKDGGNAPNAREISAMLILRHAVGARHLCASSAGTSTMPPILCTKKAREHDNFAFRAHPLEARTWLTFMRDILAYQASQTRIMC